MAKKSKNLIDSFMSGLMAEAKSAVDSVTEEEKPAKPKRAIRVVSTTDPVTHRPSDPESDRPSDPWTNPPTTLVTQGPSDPVTDIVTQEPSDLHSDPEPQESSDLVEPQKPTPKEHRGTVGDLTDRQYQVLKHIYFNRPFKVYTDKGLGAIDGMGPNNAKNQIRSLCKKGYIHKPYSINDGVRKGSTCKVVEKKCLPLFGPTDILNPPESKTAFYDLVTHRPTDPVTDRPSDPQAQRHSDPVTDPENASYNSSSSLLLKKTTTKAEIELSQNPELGYWRQKGLTAKQMVGWTQKFNISLETVIEALCWCRFDLVECGRENDKKDPVRDALNWIHGILQSTGGYKKPTNYKSWQEIEAARERERIEEVKRQAKQLQQLREEAAEAKFDLEFEQMLQKPDGEQYKKCLEKIPPIAKQPHRKGSKTFITAMKKAFIEGKEAENN